MDEQNKELPIMTKTEEMDGFGEWDILVLYCPAADISSTCKDPNMFIPAFFCTDMVDKYHGICIPLPRALNCTWDQMIEYALRTIDENVKEPPPGTKRKLFGKCYRGGLVPSVNGMDPFCDDK